MLSNVDRFSIGIQWCPFSCIVASDKQQGTLVGSNCRCLELEKPESEALVSYFLRAPLHVGWRDKFSTFWTQDQNLLPKWFFYCCLSFLMAFYSWVAILINLGSVQPGVSLELCNRFVSGIRTPQRETCYVLRLDSLGLWVYSQTLGSWFGHDFKSITRLHYSQILFLWKIFCNFKINTQGVFLVSPSHMESRGKSVAQCTCWTR